MSGLGPGGRQTERRPPARPVPVAALVAALLAASTASGYSKFEHEQLTFYSFELARQRVCSDSALPPEVCRGFQEIPPSELGVVTRAVDYFSNPRRLAPVAAACIGDQTDRRQHGGCRDSVRKACRGTSAGDCLDFAFHHTRKKVRQRRRNRLYRALAVHRNDEHFRQGAQQEYDRMHGKARRLAAEGHFGLALIAEAIAIHFLQDGFSPGHLAAPRDQYGDSHAGALHDRANGKGLAIWVDADLCVAAEELGQPLAELLAAEGGARFAREFALVTQKKQSAASGEPDPPGKRIAVGKQIPPAEVREDLETFHRRCESGAFEYDAFGDKRLLAGRYGSSPARRPSPEAKSLHRVSLLALAVMSIEDVLRYHELPEPLRLCFHPPSLAHRADGKRGSRLLGPGLAVGRRADPWPASGLCWRGEQEGLFFGYLRQPGKNDDSAAPPRLAADALTTGGSPGGRYHLRVGVQRINSLQAAISYWGARRRRFEIGHDVYATESYFERTKSGDLKPVSRRKFVLITGYGVHLEEQVDFRAVGAGLVLTTGTQFKDLDVYLALEPGFGHYRVPGGETTRYRWSARAGIGLSVFAVEGIVERGLELTPAGGLETRWRPSVNLRFRLAPTWLATPFKKLQRGRGQRATSGRPYPAR